MTEHVAIGHAIVAAIGLICMVLGPIWGAGRQPEDLWVLWGSRAVTAIGVLSFVGSLVMLLAAGLRAG